MGGLFGDVRSRDERVGSCIEQRYHGPVILNRYRCSRGLEYRPFFLSFYGDTNFRIKSQYENLLYGPYNTSLEKSFGPLFQYLTPYPGFGTGLFSLLRWNPVGIDRPFL